MSSTAQKTIQQFQAEAAVIRRAYRDAWSTSPNFRLSDGGVDLVGHTTTESALFARAFMECTPHGDAGPNSPTISNSPNMMAGLAGFISGLCDEDNVAILRYDWVNNPNDRQAAFTRYLARAGKQGICSGLIHGIVWAAVDFVVDNCWDQICDKIPGLFSVEAGRELTRVYGGLCAVIFIKLVVDTILYWRGYTTRHPFGEQNLTTTTLSVLLAVAMAHFIVGPSSWIVAFIAGNFANAYLSGLVREKCDRNESIFRTIARRVAEIRDWASGRFPHEGNRWIVPTELEDQIPSEMVCVISTSLFMEPALLHDMVFEKQDLLCWVRARGCHPLNARMQVSISEVMPAPEMKQLCHEFAQMHNLMHA